MGKRVTLFDTGRKYYLTESYVEETSARQYVLKYMCCVL